MIGADYSDARPGGAALAAAGISSVGRYVGNVGDGRCLTADEYADLRAHGIDVWLIREGSGTEMLGGRVSGQQQATVAQQAIERLGLPADSVVYFTADFAVQSAQYGVCDDYLRGVNDVFQSPNRIGLYAGVPYIVHVKGWGGAAYWWKPGASSWSDGQTTDLHLEQLVGTAAGIAGTDANIIYQSDHGQVGTSRQGVTSMAFEMICDGKSIVFCDEWGSENIANYMSADIQIGEFVDAANTVFGSYKNVTSRQFDIARAISDRRRAVVEARLASNAAQQVVASIGTSLAPAVQAALQTAGISGVTPEQIATITNAITAAQQAVIASIPTAFTASK